MSIYVGVDTKARHIKQIYIGIGGKARRVSKAYLGVGGKARLIYTSLAQLIKDIPTTVGQTCTWAGYNWTIAHITNDLIYMISTNIVSMPKFGSNTRYSQSNLIGLCDNFLAAIPTNYQAVLADVTVNGVTQKVFVPAHGMVCNNSPAPYSGTDGTNNYQGLKGTYGDGTTAYPCFDLFKAAYNTDYANRIATYNGNANPWWLSTAYSSDSVRSVDKGGKTSSGVSNYNVIGLGFRPCVAIKRKL